MRRLILILMALCGAAWAQVVQPIIQAHATSGVQTCVYSNNVVTGDILVVGGHTEGTLTGISDTLLSSWTLVDSSTVTLTTRVWVAVAASSGADTVTVTGTNSFNGLVCAEFDKNYTTSTVDVHTNGSFSGTPATFTTTGITPTVNGNVLFAIAAGFHNSSQEWPVYPLQILHNVNGADDSGSGFEVLGQSGSSTSVTFNNTSDVGNYVVITLKATTGITITTSALRTGSLTNSYSYCLHAVQGAGAYTWSVSSGALPTGLSINSSTGCISGTPTGGTTTPTFQVTDGSNTTTKALTLTVNSSVSTATFVQGVMHAALTSVSVGDVLIVGGFQSGNATLSNLVLPTDSLGTIYRYVGSTTNASATSPTTSWIWIGKATSGGSDTLTCGFCNESSFLQVSNVQNVSDVSVFTTGVSAAGATITSGSLTTPAPNSFFYAVSNSQTGGSTLAAVAPFTSDGSSSFPALAEYNIFASASSQSASFTQTGNTNGNWTISGIVLSPSTSGVVNTNHRRAWVISQ